MYDILNLSASLNASLFPAPAFLWFLDEYILSIRVWLGYPDDVLIVSRWFSQLRSVQ
jgi:hypothetical protein